MIGNLRCAAAHRAVDESITYLSEIREAPVWRDMPPSVRAAFEAPLPMKGQGLESILDEINANLMPYPMGNVHPRACWALVHGVQPNFTGALGDFLAAVQGSNLGGGNHAAALMDQQVVGWLKTMMGFPEAASGTLTSGGFGGQSPRTFHRTQCCPGTGGRCVNMDSAVARLAFYGSDQMHGCHLSAMEILGLGRSALRKIPSLPDYHLNLDLLQQRIAEDRADGVQPVAIIATAGTINTGAIDDLTAIAEIADL